MKLRTDLTCATPTNFQNLYMASMDKPDVGRSQVRGQQPRAFGIHAGDTLEVTVQVVECPCARHPRTLCYARFRAARLHAPPGLLYHAVFSSKSL
jgi:hypothetical protein